MSNTEYDVALVGYGPVSKAMAIMLSRLGHRVAVFERFPEIYPLPRAVCLDHEIHRVLHANGLGAQLEAFASPPPKYRWFNAEWRELLCLDHTAQSVSGGPEVYFVHQPSVERALDGVVRETKGVALRTGWEAVDLTQTADCAELTIRDVRSGATEKVRSRYLVGMDGANSFVRETMRWPREDLGFEADWLVIDMALKPGVTVESLGIPECGQYCNPLRPTTIVPGGMDGDRVCRRWEFMRLPHETKAEMETPEKVWELLGAWVSPDQADLVRHSVYTFRSLVATTWRAGRIMIGGDAAHVMPPFLGQGMCAGMRDAWNLAWKLDMVLAGRASDHLLDTYQPERAPHVSDVIKASIFLGQIICVPDPVEAAKRDEAFLSGKAPPPAPFPILTDGLIDRDIEGKPRGVAGKLSPHARVRTQAGEGRFDQVVGLGFVLALAAGLDLAALSEPNRAFLDRLGARLVVFADRPDGPNSVVDLEGRYLDFMKREGVEAIVVRPDFNLFGGARAAEVNQLVESLATQLLRWGYRDRVGVSGASPRSSLAAEV